MKAAFLAVLLALVPFFAPRAETGSSQRLDDFLARTHSLRADFIQDVYDDHGRRIEESRGTMYLQRPDRFRWDYSQPYPQIIVGDGKRVWIYDKELEQVTVKPMQNTLTGTPAELLSTTRPLEESFHVRDAGTAEGLEWVELTPKQPEASFSEVRLGFEGDALRRMQLKDSFGQTTRIEFSDVSRNPHLDPDLFTFTPPAGADVVGDTGKAQQ